MSKEKSKKRNKYCSLSFLMGSAERKRTQKQVIAAKKADKQYKKKLKIYKKGIKLYKKQFPLWGILYVFPPPVPPKRY